MTTYKTIDANEAVARVAYQLSEVIAIYPITPASPMGEWADEWASKGMGNLWGDVPSVVEMQSEGGAAGAIHGSLQTGSLTTTFTASQGLLLMMPNMYKIAGELTPAVFHVAARSLAAQALSIFCDHADVMAVRGTGFALLSSSSVQEAQDFAVVAHAATLQSRIPFVHFFDGFRTSHEIQKVTEVSAETLRAMVDDDLVAAHRGRALTPDRPVIRGTAQNPDVYFQAREAVNAYYLACPEIVEETMASFGRQTGRHYRLFEYVGPEDAERVLVVMGSGAETAEETVHHFAAQGEKIGVLKVRLYRPFSAGHFVGALPPTVRTIGVLDRTKEPGSPGEPLYLDVQTAVCEHRDHFVELPRVAGGRFGLSSKEFTPGMVKGVFDELAKERPKNHFTVGIVDDVTHTSLAYDPDVFIEPEDTVRAIFHGLGSDGTVGANKNTIKIIGEETESYAQGYFVYDSKKSGSVTISHLRFGPSPIRAPYLIQRANFVACHQFHLMNRFDVLAAAEPQGAFLLNSPYGPKEVWDHLPAPVQQAVVDKNIRFFIIDAAAIAKEFGLGARINTTMQACFFAVTEVLPRDAAVAAIKTSIEKSYGKRGDVVLKRNFAAVDAALEHLHEVNTAGRSVTGAKHGESLVPDTAPDFVKAVTARLMAGEGDALPVSALPVDGTFPTGTAKWEKRNIAAEIPVWDPDICIQCGKCVMVCPHGVIRGKVFSPGLLADAPEGFLSAPPKWKEFSDKHYTLQVAPEDCTGCSLCVEVCPVKNKREVRLKAINMRPQAPLLEEQRANWDYFLSLDNVENDDLHVNRVKDVQLLEPFFEFSGACGGCGETPYLKLVTQLFGDRMVVANATGCSSIYGGNLPATPWTVNAEGRGPAWSNSLFEDNAEFGLGMRVSLNQLAAEARSLVTKLAGQLDGTLVRGLLSDVGRDQAAIDEQRARVAALKDSLRQIDSPDAARLLTLADGLVPKSVWIIGGDGWAYDIGFGGVDHVLASGQDVNILVLDTEVYSNTGGQMSKATPRGAVAKFASGGKPMPKKDLAQIALTYGNVYVARVAMGADDTHTVKALREAEAFRGPSLIIAYSHCIAHGYDLRHGMDQQKLAVKSGYWPLLRHDPALAEEGRNPLMLDSKAPAIPLSEYMYNEGRFKMLVHSDPEKAKSLLGLAQQDVNSRWAAYEQRAAGTDAGKEEEDHG